jgi:plasmid stabilization system protein ParE
MVAGSHCRTSSPCVLISSKTILERRDVLRSIHPQCRDAPSQHPGRVPGTRELVIPRTPFIVPYRLVGNAIHVLRIFHAARQWPEAF